MLLFLMSSRCIVLFLLALISTIFFPTMVHGQYPPSPRSSRRTEVPHFGAPNQTMALATSRNNSSVRPQTLRTHLFYLLNGSVAEDRRFMWKMGRFLTAAGAEDREIRCYGLVAVCSVRLTDSEAEEIGHANPPWYRHWDLNPVIPFHPGGSDALDASGLNRSITFMTAAETPAGDPAISGAPTRVETFMTCGEEGCWTTTILSAMDEAIEKGFHELHLPYANCTEVLYGNPVLAAAVIGAKDKGLVVECSVNIRPP